MGTKKQEIAFDDRIFSVSIYLYMKIQDAVHALILFDQKKLISRKTILRSSSGTDYKFIRVDTQLNWPRLIAEDDKGLEVILNSKDVRSLQLEAREPGLSLEPFSTPP